MVLGPALLDMVEDLSALGPCWAWDVKVVLHAQTSSFKGPKARSTTRHR
jgi:hypothetical protein